MKRKGAFVLAFLVLLLSLESTVGMHFCQNTLVETSINTSLTSCCQKTKANQHPTFSGICCEIAHFTAELQETVVADADVSFSKLITVLPVIQIELDIPQYTPNHQTVSFESPPEPHHTSLHILFEQYLI